MKSVLVIFSVVVVFSAVALAQTQRDQVMAAQHYQQQQTQQQQQQQSHHQGHGDLKSSGSKVTRRDYSYDNSYLLIGLCLIPLLVLLCFPLFSTPYYGGHHGGGHHHGGWGWGRSAKDTEAIQERVLKGVEG